MLISDSICRDIYLPDAEAYVLPGASINTVSTHIRNTAIEVSAYTNIILHIGVCDILNMMNSKDTDVQNSPPHVILCRYLDLILAIRGLNARTIIQVSGVIPVLRQHKDAKYLIMGINNGLKLITAKLPNCTYLDTPSLFCKNFDPLSHFFTDGLHLTFPAKAILGGRIRQAFNMTQVLDYWKTKRYNYLKDYPINIYNFYSFLPTLN